MLRGEVRLIQGDEMEMLDITAPRLIEIVVSNDRKRVWINTEKGCIFRACRIGELIITPGIPTFLPLDDVIRFGGTK